MENDNNGEQCGVEWKYWECLTRPAWRVFSNNKEHSRGSEVCTGAHRVPITKEVKQYITKMDLCGVRPRHIWSQLRRTDDIPAPPLGIPSRQQVADCVKRQRKKNLSRNTREAVKKLVKEYPYYGGTDGDKAFLFGPTLDDDGFPHIGKGSDESPFVLGVSTLRLLSKVNQLRGDDHVRLFHTNATFKLSDLGYPVITCGFTDRSLVYHLVAILVVSARTHREYELAFGCVAPMYQRIFETPLCVDAVMGGAEDAQYNALQSVGAFRGSKYLMCFFHVLYNVHKRTRHLDTEPGVAVFTRIMDMHYTTSYTELCTVKERVISAWMAKPTLRDFANYFSEQWIDSRYWRWQVFHTPSSYATTNNPREVFNASVKRHVQRKASEIGALLRSMITLAEDVGCDVPSPSAMIADPNAEIKKTAKWMLKAKGVALIRTPVDSKVRVLHILEVHTDSAAMETMRRLASSVIVGAGVETSLSSLVLEKAEKVKASRLYRDSVKWSTRRAHRVNMPVQGWTVDVAANSCGFSMHLKFGICSHVILVRTALGLGNEHGEKLQSRRARQKQRSERAEAAMFATYSVTNHVASERYVESTTTTSIITPTRVNPAMGIVEEIGFDHGGFEPSYVPLQYHAGDVGLPEGHEIVGSQPSFAVTSHQGFLPTNGATWSSPATCTYDSHQRQTELGNWLAYSIPYGAAHADAHGCFDAHANLDQPDLNFVGAPTPAYYNEMSTRHLTATNLAGTYPSQSFDVYSPAGIQSSPATRSMWSPIDMKVLPMRTPRTRKGCHLLSTPTSVETWQSAALTYWLEYPLHGVEAAHHLQPVHFTSTSLSVEA